jgi:hypothetical protein
MSDIDGNMAVAEATVDEILARGVITADDVLKLRRGVFMKGVVTAKDAEMAFALNDRFNGSADPTWPPFFVEALVDYVVMQAEPAGYISESNADWLMARISHSGRVETDTELELLVKALERAKLSPVKLVSFALEQVKWGVLEADGFIGRNRKLEPGVVGEPETELVRRILYAFGGDGNIAVTRQESAVLFDINDATAEAANDPDWSDLFVKAIANFLMATLGYQVPTRQEALRREAWLDAPTPGVSGFMSQMLTGSLSAIWDAYEHGSMDGEPRKPATSGFTFDDVPRASVEDAHWIVMRIRGDRRLHENEVALINFLKSRDAHRFPKLRPILDLAAA